MSILKTWTGAVAASMMPAAADKGSAMLIYEVSIIKRRKYENSVSFDIPDVHVAI